MSSMSKTIVLPKTEMWNESTEQFVDLPRVEFKIVHSLVSISKWEAIWHKAFLGKKDKTVEEFISYIKCMTITQNVPDEVYDRIDNAILNEVISYVEDPMSCTCINGYSEDKHKKGDTLTSELIYYYMTAFNIPFSCEKWHLNKLISLIKVCEAKTAAPEKQGRGKMARHYAALNKKRLGK